MSTVNVENGFNKIQINRCVDKTADGQVIKRSLLCNIRTDSVEEAVRLHKALAEALETGAEVQDKKAKKNVQASPKCPKCGIPMMIRQNGKEGTTFFGCRGYPRCKGTRPRKEDVMRAKGRKQEVIDVEEVAFN